MPRKAKEIAVKWLQSKDIGKIHRVNVKHVLGKLQEVAAGGEVVIKLNFEVQLPGERPTILARILV